MNDLEEQVLTDAFKSLDRTLNEIDPKLRDMSAECGLGYEESYKNHTNEEYYDKYCKHCKFMCETCMYGEW